MHARLSAFSVMKRVLLDAARGDISQRLETPIIDSAIKATYLLKRKHKNVGFSEWARTSFCTRILQETMA